jgi:hypothetical protein
MGLRRSGGGGWGEGRRRRRRRGVQQQQQQQQEEELPVTLPDCPYTHTQTFYLLPKVTIETMQQNFRDPRKQILTTFRF